MEYAKRTDANQSPIMAELRAALPEATLQPTSRAGDGFPDFAVGLWGQTYLVEVKTPTGTLTKAQGKFHLRWQGHSCVATSTAEVLASILRHLHKMK